MDRICAKRIFPFKNKKGDHHHLILHIWISLATKFQLQLIILTFGPNLPKKHSSNQKQKMWTSPLNSACSNLCRHQISASTDNFDFLDQICPERVFPLKEKWTASLNFAYSNYSRYQISASTDKFDSLEQTCPKRVFPVKNKKSEYHRWILHVRISVGTKFQLKVASLIFWTKFAQKGYFYSKTKKKSSIIEFCIFDLV